MKNRFSLRLTLVRIGNDAASKIDMRNHRSQARINRLLHHHAVAANAGKVRTADGRTIDPNHHQEWVYVPYCVRDAIPENAKVACTLAHVRPTVATRMGATNIRPYLDGDGLVADWPQHYFQS